MLKVLLDRNIAPSKNLNFHKIGTKTNENVYEEILNYDEQCEVK